MTARSRLRAVALRAALAVATGNVAISAQFVVPQNDGWVTDRAHLLTFEQERELEALMQSYQAGSGHDIALLTLPDLGGRALEEVALATARAWKLGQRDLHDGALLLVAVAERRVRIEVGRGLEGTLTDAVCGRIIRGTIAPAMRAGRPHAGLRAGLLALHAAAGGAYAEPSAREVEVPSLLVFGLLAIVVFLLLHAKRRAWWPGGPATRGAWYPGYGGFSGGQGGSFSGGGFSGFGGGGGFSGGGASGGW